MKTSFVVKKRGFVRGFLFCLNYPFSFFFFFKLKIGAVPTKSMFYSIALIALPHSNFVFHGEIKGH